MRTPSRLLRGGEVAVVFVGALVLRSFNLEHVRRRNEDDQQFGRPEARAPCPLPVRS